MFHDEMFLLLWVKEAPETKNELDVHPEESGKCPLSIFIV